MECLNCKIEMEETKKIANDHFKYRLYECKECGSFGHMYYHPNTETVRKAEWDAK